MLLLKCQDAAGKNYEFAFGWALKYYWLSSWYFIVMHAHGLYESGNDAENRHIIDKNMILFSSYTLMDGSSG